MRVPAAISYSRSMVLQFRDLGTAHLVIDINALVMRSSVNILLGRAICRGEVTANQSTQYCMALISSHRLITGVLQVSRLRRVVHPSVIPFVIPKTARAGSVGGHFADIPKLDCLIFTI
nr:hypothetical protein Iba_chr07aCG8920 [Ipomoea batatas]